jgi:hypothetical protein
VVADLQLVPVGPVHGWALGVVDWNPVVTVLNREADPGPADRRALWAVSAVYQKSWQCGPSAVLEKNALLYLSRDVSN